MKTTRTKEIGWQKDVNIPPCALLLWHVFLNTVLSYILLPSLVYFVRVYLVLVFFIRFKKLHRRMLGIFIVFAFLSAKIGIDCKNDKHYTSSQRTFQRWIPVEMGGKKCCVCLKIFSLQPSASSETHLFKVEPYKSLVLDLNHGQTSLISCNYRMRCFHCWLWFSTDSIL